MKRLLSLILAAMMLFAVVSAFTGCGGSTDYSSPQKMYEAYKDGEDIVGKTVDMYASHDYYMGQVFSGPTPDLGPTMYIDLTGDGAENVKKSDHIQVKITSIDRESQFQIALTGELVN